MRWLAAFALLLCGCTETPDPVTLAVGLRFPVAVAFDSFGNLYVCEFSADRVSFLQNSSGELTVFAEAIPGASGIAIDSENRVFVSSLHEGAIYRFTRDGRRTVFAEGLKAPAGLFPGLCGKLWVAESGSGRILEIGPGGERRVVVSGLFSPASVVRQGRCLLAGCRDGLYQCCPGREPVAVLEGRYGRHAALAAARDGTVWVLEADGGGAYAIHPRLGILPLRLRLDGVAAVCDRDGDLYAATLDGRIRRVDMTGRTRVVMNTRRGVEQESCSGRGMWDQRDVPAD
jgi:streptogramin lyase